MTLADFQAGAGVPLNDQIILVDNPRLFRGFTPAFYPWWRLRNRVRKYPMECFSRRLRYRLHGFTIPEGLRAEQIFAGSFDRSFDDLDNLRSLYAFIRSKPHRDFTLIIGKGDYAVTEERLAEMPPNISIIYANNVCVTDHRVRYVPMGRDFRSRHLFKTTKPSAEKTNTCYCNFSISTHPVRQQVHRMLLGKTFVKMEHMGEFLRYSLSREQFFRDLSASKFSVCPRGNAIDTFRLWDSLYVGTIPIVVREAAFHDQLTDLPILFLERYEDFGDLTVGQLEDIYSSMQHRVFNYGKLTAAHWLPRLPLAG